MGKISDIPAPVLRHHLQKWFLDSPTFTKDQDDEQKKTLNVWKEGRCVCKSWATEALVPETLIFKGAEQSPKWKPTMFSRKSKTMLQVKWPEKDEAKNATAFGKMMEEITNELTPKFPRSRTRMEIWNTSPPDKCREWQSQIKISDYDLVTTCQNVAPEVIHEVVVCDSLSPMGLMRNADWCKEKGEKHEKMLALSAWVGAREFDKEAWLDEWFAPYPNIYRLSVFFPFCTTTSNWNGITMCEKLTELRIDFINCKEEAKWAPKGLFAGDVLPLLKFLCISRLQPNHTMAMIEGRTQPLPEFWLTSPAAGAAEEIDISALGTVQIGKVILEGKFSDDEKTAWIAKVQAAVAPGTEVEHLFASSS